MRSGELPIRFQPPGDCGGVDGGLAIGDRYGAARHALVRGVLRRGAAMRSSTSPR
jgi:hypothetical protein